MYHIYVTETCAPLAMSVTDCGIANTAQDDLVTVSSRVSFDLFGRCRKWDKRVLLHWRSASGGSAKI